MTYNVQARIRMTFNRILGSSDKLVLELKNRCFFDQKYFLTRNTRNTRKDFFIILYFS